MGHSMSLEAPRAPRVEEPVLLGMASRVPAVGRGVAFNSKLTSPGVPAATPAAPPPAATGASCPAGGEQGARGLVSLSLWAWAVSGGMAARPGVSS